ncbi:MAG: PmoA family protein [Planctomycetaceae bacterium]|nr:PmoA family protein [Planctomycetaceae bacterium]
MRTHLHGCLVLCCCAATAAAQTPTSLAFAERSDRLVITHAGQPAAEFVFADQTILRPYFANLYGPGGVKVTRNHPPLAGVDADDHAAMHPGLWLAFGDISGSDFWRNQGRIEHQRFLKPPAVGGDRLEFATESRLQGNDGSPLCRMNCDISLTLRPTGYLITWQATFLADSRDLTWGDQEEMGFGARVATPMTEKNGGQIRSSRGLKSAQATWGQPAEWCDYAGVIDGRQCGITLLADPGNFRPSWWHNRDYGVFVANPFGRAAMKQGPVSSIRLRRGETLKLRFGAVIHSGEAYDPAAEYRAFAANMK